MRRVLDRLADGLPPARRAELGVRWNEPSGGFFLSLTVGFEVDDAALTRSAEEYGVIWTPMRYFHPDDGGRNAIRLSVSYLSPEEIDEGITRLVAFLAAETSRHRARPNADEVDAAIGSHR
jgi:(S)-3,5-dihydroxyphenylglycine transaminase